MATIKKLRAFPAIRVRNLQRVIPLNVAGLENFAVQAVQHCLMLHTTKETELAKLREIFVWLISDRRMARLHRQFLSQARPTDVLTFDYGEIFASVETARRNARVFGNSLKRELQLYIVHGLLHLHGFDDRTKADARKMKKTQQKILRRLCHRGCLLAVGHPRHSLNWKRGMIASWYESDATAGLCIGGAKRGIRGADCRVERKGRSDDD